MHVIPLKGYLEKEEKIFQKVTEDERINIAGQYSKNSKIEKKLTTKLNSMLVLDIWISLRVIKTNLVYNDC